MQLDEFIRRLQGNLGLQIQDAGNQGDRQTAAALQRIQNAVSNTLTQAAAAAEAKGK